jgi:hypothetical protein
LSRLFKDFEEQITTLSGIQEGLTTVATAGDEV